MPSATGTGKAAPVERDPGGATGSSPRGFGALWVQFGLGLGSRVEGLGFRVQGLGFRV